MTDRVFKHYPEDFGELPCEVIHFDLLFDVHEKATTAKVDQQLKTKEPVKELKLNAKNLKILHVSCKGHEVDYEYKDPFLHVTFKDQLDPETTFTLHTETACTPSSNLLEGLYFDETPPGCPQQQITQCQQWGFQRIVPCFDDMTAKCTYQTTIRANARYTNILTNGDVSIPVKDIEDERIEIEYENSKTPMASYLFFLGVGTYATFTREFEYPNGDKFQLELLVPPGSNNEVANHALDVLHDAVMWIYVFTGAKQYDHLNIRKEMWELIEKREILKESKNEEELKEIREKLVALDQSIVTGYKYTGKVYREIGMQNSDFGGMENVGNTTITTNRIMPFPEMSDPSFEYMTRVKAHEFYHNLNGSEVTGRSPFEIWLNEAVTVHIEKQFHAFLFGEEYARLETVQTLLSPDGGTFRNDEGATSMPIEPDGFNDPNELITGVTYVKAPEFVRMIEILMGRGVFAQGLADYHAKYKHSNASRAQWVESMENACGKKFEAMAHTWLKQTGYPTVNIEVQYDTEKRSLSIHVKQFGGKEPWQFPFSVALCDSEGKTVAEEMKWIQKEEDLFIFENIDEPAFFSFCRGYSFYGKIKYHPTKEALYLQVHKDTDSINRYMAYYWLMDQEKMRHLKDKDAQVSDAIIDLYLDLLSDDHLMKTSGGQFMANFEHVEDESYAHRYQELYDVKKKIKIAIAKKHKERLLALYNKYNVEGYEGSYIEQWALASKDRQVKNVCLALLASLDSQEVHTLIKKQYENPTAASDKYTAFRLYLESSAEDKVALLERFEHEAKESLVSWEIFLALVGGSDADNVFEIIHKVEESKEFRIDQTNDQRALYGRFAMNKKISLQTEKGREFMRDMLIKLAPINEYTSVHMVNIFASIDRMEAHYHEPLVKMLVEVLDAISKEAQPSVYNTIRRLLLGNPDALKAHEAKYGKFSH